MHGVELAGLTSAVAEATDDLESLAVQDVDPLVGAIGNIQEPLLRIFREGYVPHRSVAQRVLVEERFLYKGAVGLKHLHTVVHAVADIYETVVGDIGAEYRVAELLRDWGLRIVIAKVGVVRLLTVRAPIPLELAGGGVEHNHAAVPVAVGNVQFIGLLIDEEFGREAEVGGVIAAFAHARFAK